MPDGVEAAIEGALLAEAQAFANAQSLTISMPNRPFTPPPDKSTESGVTAYGKWLRATLLPADTEGPFLANDDPNYHYGFLQLDVFYAQTAGVLAPDRIVDAATAYFARGTTMTRDGFTVKVHKPPARRGMIKDDPWIMIPVRIPYCCFANPA